MGPEVALIAGAVGAGMSAAGTIQSGIAASEAASYRAQVARNNETITNQRAQYAAKAGQVASEAAGRTARAKQGALTAALAASGLDVNTGSAEDLRESTAMTGRFNQEAALHNSILAQYGFRSQAMNYAAQAGLEDAAADQAITGAIFGAAGSALGGLSKTSLLSGTSALPTKYAWMGEPAGDWSSRGGGVVF